MVQKVLKVGSSAAVTIPKKSLEKLGLKIGDHITLDVDIKKRAAIVKPVINLSGEDLKIAGLTLDFVNRYREDLESLAKK